MRGVYVTMCGEDVCEGYGDEVYIHVCETYNTC